MAQEWLKSFFKEYQYVTIYGEWLVKHTVNYLDEAWRKFYIFDVMRGEDHLHYLEYFGMFYPEFLFSEVIPFIELLENPTYEIISSILEKNNYLLPNGKIGEGLVIKNYSYKNKFGRQTWVKIVHSEYKEQKTGGFQETALIEEQIIQDFCTEAFIEKEFQKIAVDGWSSKKIGLLLGNIFHYLLKEEICNIVKKLKQPTINFKLLNSLVVKRVKAVKPEIF